MSQLKAHDKVIFEKLFDRGGYVLDFTDRTFAEFFRENGIDIDDNKYRINGSSKMKRLRAFWEIESDKLVGKVLQALLKYACAKGEVTEQDKSEASVIIARLVGANQKQPESFSNESDFLAKNFVGIDLTKLNIDAAFQSVIDQRINEIQKTLQADAALSVVFLCGSTLEGLLLDAASKKAQLFNQAKSAQKDKAGNVQQFHQWKLESLINTAHEIGLLSLDIKKYSHELKDFRNFIHPREQAVQNFKPDAHTARISWQVLLAAIADLGGQRKK